MDILIEIKETVARTEYKLLTINNPQDNSDICFKNNKVSLSNSKSLTTLLPVKTVEDVLKLEETLKNEEQQRKLKAMLNELEGKDCRNLLARMLSEIFTNKIAVKCSWHGYGEHFKVGNTKTIEIIKDVLLETYPQTTNKEFEYIGGCWFRHGKERYLKERKKPN